MSKVRGWNSTLYVDTEKGLRRTESLRDATARKALEKAERTGEPVPRSSFKNVGGPIGLTTRAQRAFVKDFGRCLACGEENATYVRLTFAHWWPQGRSGCGSPLCGHVLCVRPGGEGCHDRQERGELDLLALIVAEPFWDASGRERFRHALEHALPLELIQHLTGERYVPESMVRVVKS